MNGDPVMTDMAAARAPLVLTLDVGSSSTRAALFDRAGRRIANSLRQVSYRLTTTPDGGGVLDPAELMGHLEAVIDAALEAAGPRAGDIGAVGTTTFWHSLMGIDATGEPVTPVYTLADTRAAGAARRLATRLDAEASFARTGARIHASYPTAKLFWLRTEHPELFTRVARWLSFGEYVSLTLFGQTWCSTSMASGTGLFNQFTQAWDAVMLDAVGVDAAALSPVRDEPASGLVEPYRRRWPALAAIPWLPPLGDGASGNLGAGAYGRDRLSLMVGTTGAMRLLFAGPAQAPPRGLWLYRLDRQRVVLGGALTEGGNLYEWVSERCRLPAPAEIERALAAMPPDSHGLTWLPFLAGERSPGWRSDARATISGLTLDTTPIAILRAGLEAIAYRFAIIAGLLERAHPEERTVVACGNALLASPAWLRIMADVLGCPVVASWEREASLRGAALYALEQSGIIDDPRALASLAIEGAPRYEPDTTHHEIYGHALDRQRALYDRLMGWPGA